MSAAMCIQRHMEQRDLGAQFEHNRRDFILTEIESGLTFAKLALDARDEDKRERNIDNAHKAYDTARKFVQERPIEDEAVQAKIATGLDQLKEHLIRLDQNVS